MVNKARLTNEDLKNLPSKCFPFNAGNEVIIDKAVLEAICEELIKKRENQEKLVELLQKADEHSDKLEWKLFFKDLPKITEEFSKKFGG